MEFQPKKLALLISLIGAGVSPYAYARSDLRAANATPSPLSIALDESATWAAAPAWREEEGTLELVKLPDELQYSIWVPPSSVLASEEEVPVHRAAARSTSSAQAAANTAATHSDRLMESLAAILLDDIDALDADTVAPAWAEHAVEPASQHAEQRELVVTAPAETVLRELESILSSSEADAAYDAAAAEEATEEPAVASHTDKVLATLQSTLHLEQREIVVAPSADKVLRDLEFVLSSDKIRLGTYGTASGKETIVTTHADKVLATLEDISSARRTSEDPAERRARKFAAAQARADAAAAIAAELDIDLTQPMPVERVAIVPALLPATPAGDPAVELAMEPGPMQWFIGERYVSSVDIEREEAREPRQSPFGGEKVAINAKSLDRIRGGFIGDGLNISFGIERAVYVNGTLVTTTSLNVSDLGRITAGRGTTSFDTGTLALIQSGAGNTVTSGTFSSTSLGTVVQNTLNGQKIQSVTVINATVNSLGVLRGLNLQSSMRGAVIDSLRR